MDLRRELSAIVNCCLTEARGKADLQVRVAVRDTYVTRFSESVIFQDLGQHDVIVDLKAIVGGKEYLLSSNKLDEASLKDATRQAIDGARNLGAPNSAGLPEPKPHSEVAGATRATLECTAADRSDLVTQILKRCREQSLDASGLLTVRKRALMVANTAGIFAYTPMTEVVVNIVASSPTSTGFATLVTKDIAEADPVKLADRAISKCLASQNPIRLEPDTFEVILEPSAVACMLLWSHMGGFGAFGAPAAAAGSSVLYNNIGKQLFGPNVTIWDDGTAPDTLSMPFDFEGTPKRKTELITRGVPMGVVHDHSSAQGFGVESTGHCTPHEGPSPLHTFMAGGDCTVEDMIRNTKRGILVTRFHGAVTALDPAELLLSGTTRDGTFLIENGRVKSGIKPLRWTESVVAAFSKIEMISSDTQLVSPPNDDIPAVTTFRVPALKISRFRFTDVQDF